VPPWTRSATLPDAEGPVRIVFSPRRKRVAFRIGEDGVLEVLSPRGVPPRVLAKILDLNADAVSALRRRAERARSRRKITEREYREGETFFLMGEAAVLTLSPGKRHYCQGVLFVPPGEPEEVKAELVRLYRELAHKVLPKIFAEEVLRTGCEPKSLKINSAATRWGSCNRKGDINLSWRLLQFPERHIRHVICHELAHLAVFDHSPRFHAHLEELCPGSRQFRAEMLRFARTLPRF